MLLSRGSEPLSIDEEGRAEQLLERAQNLADRLAKGRGAIRAETDTDRADYFFERWLALLTEYEQTLDELRRLGVAEERVEATAKPDAR